MKKTLVLFLIVFGFVLSLCSCSGKQTARSAEEVAEQIEVGMTFDDVLSIVGEDGEDVGSGKTIYEWKMPDGKYLLVSFEHSPQAQNVHDCYAVSVQVKDAPFRGPAK